MMELLQQLLNGLTLGAVYALVALGVTLIFGVLGVMAFAQGAVYMVGAYLGFVVARTMSGAPWQVVLASATVIGAAGGALLNVAIDQIGYRPIRHARRLAPLIAGIGIYFFIENLMALSVGRRVFAFPDILPQGRYSYGGVWVTQAQLVLVAVAVVCMLSMWLFVRFTSAGLAIRAVSERAETATLMALEPERTIAMTFALAGAFSGVAGVLVAGFVGFVSPSMGFLIGVKAFAAAIIAGIGNVPGALLGGLLVGLIETMATGYLSAAWGDALVFVALVLVLVIRPNGLLGAHVPQRA